MMKVVLSAVPDSRILERRLPGESGKARLKTAE
jgi:hypothetical protein